VDADVKDPNNNGLDTLRIWNLIHELPRTLSTRTASGGLHLYYRLHGVRLKNSNNPKTRPGPGIDIKTVGGQVVAPGSIYNGSKYERECDLPIAMAPDWLIALCKKQTNASGPKPTVKQLVDGDDEWACARSKTYIENEVPAAEYLSRNITGQLVSAKLGDFGITSWEKRLEFLLDWNDKKCHPPLELDELEDIARSGGGSYRRTPMGSLHRDAPIFEPVEIASREAPSISPAKDEAEARGRNGPRSALHIVRADEFAQRALVAAGTPLIKGIIDRGSMGVLIGAPNSGKTFLALDWCFHVATGRPWGGRKVTQGAAVYLAAEAGMTLSKRVAALEQHYGPLANIPLYIIPCPADLAHGPDAARGLLELIRDVEKESGQKVELFVIDTLARVISGADENSAKDMGAVINAVGHIQRAAQPLTALITHHPGKDESKGGRGSSTVFAACDTEMIVKEDKRGERTLKFTKQRDNEKGADIRFRLKPVRIGMNGDGDEVTSCYVEALGSNEKTQWPLTSAQGEVKNAIYAALQNTPTKTFGWEFVREILTAERRSGKGLSRQAINEHLTALTEAGWIEKRKPNQYVLSCRNVTEDDGNQRVKIDGKCQHPIGADTPSAPAPGSSKEKETGGPAPAQQDGIPFVMTNWMREQLAAAGMSPEQIHNTTPEQAHTFLEERQQRPLEEAVQQQPAEPPPEPEDLL
jgi:hypothetical protein